MSEDKNKGLNKSETAQNEEKILDFWQDNKIFEKSLEKNDKNESFVFYDGPPFATGLPHYGHLLAGTMKDIIPRYQTMKGKKVARRWGWDCHGLPIENLIEKELNLKTKDDILKHGVENFNEAARQSVLRYDTDWKKIVPRTGRWVDMSQSYKTMDTSYSESIWHIFKTIYDKNLIYEGYKSMHLCPRCETTLSNFEVNQGYKDIKDISVTAKFELIDAVKVGFINPTLILAWTTTPWTLPGNVALAVNPDIEYSRVQIGEENVGYVVAKDLVDKIFKDQNIKITHSVSGKGLIRAEYKPVFDYYKDIDLENKENIYKIVDADFVTTEDGTGVVHIAPAFGEDDMNLGREKNLPFIQHVSTSGKFKPEVKDFAGMSVKPKEDPQAIDIEIIKNLAHRGLLFSKEKIEHSYPHCWRCDTPLLNYATSSWFLKVTDLKDKLIETNKTINWVPENMREGRFGKWLEGARDWAISRTRFWGAPLPVWKCEECEKNKVIGSIAELKENLEKKNNIFVMRHGEADNNVKNVISTQSLNNHHLTEKGKEQVSESVPKLKEEKIDLIFSSPFVRTKETAEMVAESLGIDKKEIIFDDRVGEINLGNLEGKTPEDYHNLFESQVDKFTQNPMNGETLSDVKARVSEFAYEINEKYEGKNILIVTHEYPAWMFITMTDGLTDTQSVVKKESENLVQNAQIVDLDFRNLPHNKKFEVDLHMPYIDKIQLSCECGGKMKRIPEVFDCWFESGAMPYASNHYPFENLDKFNPETEIGFPADFIAEGLDQTRGWFYTSLVLSTALFEKSSYKNVIVNGLILAEDGKKMSKSLKNYPDVNYILDKYGADAMRYYMINSPAVHAEDLNFSEKGVDEILKKIILKVKNVYSFYELYKDDTSPSVIASGSEAIQEKSSNVLDKWIIARLNQLNLEITKGLDNYELDRAARPIMDFVDDLSTWYIRRSRDRFKGEDVTDKNFALETTRFVLQEFSKLIAPIMPFLAEEVYQKIQNVNLKMENDNSKLKIESVHLENWPEIGKIDERILDNMKKVREIVSLALEARAREGVKVRQPLNKFTVYSLQITEMDKQLIEIIKDEVNVKDVVFEKGNEEKVVLDTEITSELKAEGDYRELLRNIQKMRKEAGLVPSDLVDLSIETSAEGKALVEKFIDDLKKTAGIDNIDFEDNLGQEIKIDNFEFRLRIVK